MAKALDYEKARRQDQLRYGTGKYGTAKPVASRAQRNLIHSLYAELGIYEKNLARGMTALQASSEIERLIAAKRRRGGQPAPAKGPSRRSLRRRVRVRRQRSP